MNITKRHFVRLLSFALCGLAVFGGFALREKARADAAAYKLEVRYQHAFTELVNGITEVDSALQKSMYASTAPMIAAACIDVYGKANKAQSALGNVPLEANRMANTAGFLSKTGDYSFSLAKNAAGGYTQEQREILGKLSGIAGTLRANLSDIAEKLNGGEISISELIESEREVDDAGNEIPGELAGGFKAIESEFPELPSLVYDGPFSQHLDTKSPAYTENLEEVTQEEALKIAEEFSDISNLEFHALREGKVPAYCFTSGQAGVSVTVNGGKILQISNPRDVYAQNLSVEDAVKVGKDFLGQRGYASMKESYYTLNNNVLLINFAYVQDSVVCYPDLAKVSVAMDDGSVVGFEGTGYIMNHSESREFPDIAVDRTTAEAVVSPGLKIIKYDLAIIPTDGQNEVLVHEFTCETDDGKHYIICVNALTGNEEKILILLEDENGALAI
ncbi:MAG: germination protein YpeB [Oscillospiraceae bacterium]|jgi:germination protein YpeB|nr:germination protein YpeB [Oscillospiraceae bacterium]